MGPIRAVGISPGRNPAIIELDGNEVVESINAFIFRDDNDDRPITWYEIEDGFDLIFGETEEKRKEEFEPNRSLDSLAFDVRGHALIVQHQVDDQDAYLSMSDADLAKYIAQFKLNRS